ncbi:MAG: hypothetical protein J5781_01185 [Clostridia bacterium]|nr:hypothetical protein [Clostridia bacterium]
MSKKATVQGNYQYSEANAKDAYLLRSFGWLAGKRSEHENKKGEKVYTIRRDLQVASDSVIRRTEKEFEKFYTKTQKKMRRRHRWGQAFAIIFTVLGIAAGAVFFLEGLLEPIDQILGTVNDLVKNTIDSVLNNATLAEEITGYVRYAFLGIGVISLLSVFINNARYKKRRVCPKRKYAQKYNAIARSALKEGAERLYLLKMENGSLMTQSDRRINEFGMTMRRVMDRGEEYE